MTTIRNTFFHDENSDVRKEIRCPFFSLNPANKIQRPLYGGIRITNGIPGLSGQSSWGTLGCFGVKESGNQKEVYLISNKHVLYFNDAEQGDWIYQPSLGSSKKIAMIEDGEDNNQIDAAVAKVEEGIYCINRLLFSKSRILDIANVGDDLPVSKEGGASCRTIGNVTDTIVTANPRGVIGYEQPHNKTGQIGIKSNQNHRQFVIKGDSGSVLLDDEQKVIGLLWMVKELSGEAIASPINSVLDRFELTIYPSPFASIQTNPIDLTNIVEGQIIQFSSDSEPADPEDPAIISAFKWHLIKKGLFKKMIEITNHVGELSDEAESFEYEFAEKGKYEVNLIITDVNKMSDEYTLSFRVRKA